MNEQGLLEWRDLGRGLWTLTRKIRPIAQSLPLLLRQKNKALQSLGITIAQTAKRYPEHIAIKHEGEPITYGELDVRSNRIAHYLIAAGLRQRGAVAVFMESRLEVLVVVAAIAKAGGVAGMINSNQRKRVLLHSLHCFEPTIYVVGEESVSAFEDIRGELGEVSSGSLLCVPDSGGGSVPEGYVDLDTAARGQSEALPDVAEKVQLSDPCFYIFTSGTTGLPKASIMGHKRWVLAGRLLGSSCLVLEPGETVYAPLPLYHNQALTLAWSTACVSGAAMAIRRKFSASGFWDDCRRHQASSLVYIGEIPRYLFNQPASARDREHSVRKMLGVGLRPDIWHEFKDRFGITEVYEIYAASELNLAFLNILNLDCTVGFCPLRWALVAFDVDAGEPVRDPQGRMVEVGKGEIGLLIAKVTKRFTFEGYTDPVASEKKLFRNVFEEGDVWVNSGDLMRNIGFRHLQFIDRVGDTFRWKSENVSTGEVEAIINKFDGVAESTVYGVEIPNTVGRAGMAAIVPSGETGQVDCAALLDHLRAQLPSYAIPVFLSITGPLEVTGTFKHRKIELRKQGYDPSATSDPVYVLLPGSSSYERLGAEVYGDIRNGRYAF